MNRKIAIFFSLALAAAGCKHADYSPMRIPLQWKPTDEMRQIPAAAVADLNQQTIAIGPFTDDRTDPREIGKNIEGGRNVPVSTGDGVGTFLGARFAEVLQANGVAVATGGASRVIKGAVQRYLVTEENTYHSDVALQFTVEDAGGAVLWKGVAEGTSNRFGGSFKAENYYEALSNAFLEACKDLVAKPDFLDAIRK